LARCRWKQPSESLPSTQLYRIQFSYHHRCSSQPEDRYTEPPNCQLGVFLRAVSSMGGSRSLHEPWIPGPLPVESGGAPPHSKTLARWLRGLNIRQVLECAAAAALSISHEVMVRNACGGNPVHFSFAQD